MLNTVERREKKNGSGRWRVSIILVMGRVLGNKVEARVRTRVKMALGEYNGTGSKNKVGREVGSVNIILSMGRYLVDTVEYNGMRKRSGRYVECQKNGVNGKCIGRIQWNWKEK